MANAIKCLLRRVEDRWRKKRFDDAFKPEFAKFRKINDGAGARFKMLWDDRLPFLADRTKTTSFDPHYTYHPAWAARILARERPAVHIDISSTLNFVAIASAFIPMEFYDYRPAKLILSQLKSGSQDLTQLTFGDGSIASLSCMHTIEHIGLGRYGDALDPNGDIKAANELKRVLSPGGLLIFVTPVGRSRICYNAHRIYDFAQAKSLFEGLILEQFALLPDDYSQGLIEDAPAAIVNKQEYGCGCFAFRRPRS